MFCPGCGQQDGKDVRFCRKCGANLRSVQKAMMRTGDSEIDWDKTWLKDMLLSEDEREKRKGITPEIKRMNEVKAGVITLSVGIALLIFLNLLLGAVAATLPQDEAMIVRNIWVAGMIPLMVGLALIFNGLVVSKRIVKLRTEQQVALQTALQAAMQTPTQSAITDSIGSTAQLKEGEPSQIFSVTESPTYSLTRPSDRETQ